MTTIKLSGGCLGSETMMVRCDLSQASAPVQVNYDNGEGWVGTQYQCAGARHLWSGLVAIARRLAAHACEASEADAEECDVEDIEIVYVVRDASGEYIGVDGERTPASDEAQQFDSREEAQAACERATDKVLSREAE